MKKFFVGLLLVVSLVAVVWNANANAACENAIFSCYNSSGQKLGEISVTCSEKVPYGGFSPRCLPDLPFNAFASIDECKKTYPTVIQACPNVNTWPSGYAYSSCVKYPGY